MSTPLSKAILRTMFNLRGPPRKIWSNRISVPLYLLFVFRLKHRSKRAHQHQSAAPDPGRVEQPFADQLVKLRPAQAGGLARLRDRAGEALSEGNGGARRVCRRLFPRPPQRATGIVWL